MKFCGDVEKIRETQGKSNQTHGKFEPWREIELNRNAKRIGKSISILGVLFLCAFLLAMSAKKYIYGDFWYYVDGETMRCRKYSEVEYIEKLPEKGCDLVIVETGGELYGFYGDSYKIGEKLWVTMTEEGEIIGAEYVKEH